MSLRESRLGMACRMEEDEGEKGGKRGKKIASSRNRGKEENALLFPLQEGETFPSLVRLERGWEGGLSLGRKKRSTHNLIGKNRAGRRKRLDPRAMGGKRDGTPYFSIL